MDDDARARREWVLYMRESRWRDSLRQRRRVAAHERREMTQLYTIHPDDVAALAVLREQLSARRAALKRRITDAAVRVGRAGEFVSMLERGVSPSPRMSSLQLWAAAVDARIEFDLAGLWDLDSDDPEMVWLYDMSRPWGKDVEMRLWLVAALKAMRVAKGIDIDVVAKGIGMARNGAYRWEWESVDPLWGRAAATARLLGSELLMSVIFSENFQVES